jgi:hypothetical protein
MSSLPATAYSSSKNFTLHANPIPFGKLVGILTVVSEIIAYIHL